jgi:hypothetical protein
VSNPIGISEHKRGSAWSLDEYVVVADLFIRRGRSSGARDHEVLHLADLLGRSPASVSRRLGNFAGTANPGRGLKPVEGEARHIFERMLHNEQERHDIVDRAMTNLASGRHAFDSGQRIGPSNVGGRPYVSPTRTGTDIPERRVFDFDPDQLDRGTRAHMDTQDALAAALQAADIDPRAPKSGDPQFDVAWTVGRTAFVAEIKSITRKNEERQLRLGLGQVLSYAHLLSWPHVEIAIPVLVVEHEPHDSYWLSLCARHGVMLSWPSSCAHLISECRALAGSILG